MCHKHVAAAQDVLGTLTPDEGEAGPSVVWSGSALPLACEVTRQSPTKCSAGVDSGQNQMQHCIRLSVLTITWHFVRDSEPLLHANWSPPTSGTSAMATSSVASFAVSGSAGVSGFAAASPFVGPAALPLALPRASVAKGTTHQENQNQCRAAVVDRTKHWSYIATA